MWFYPLCCGCCHCVAAAVTVLRQLSLCWGCCHCVAAAATVLRLLPLCCGCCHCVAAAATVLRRLSLCCGFCHMCYSCCYCVAAAAWHRCSSGTVAATLAAAATVTAATTGTAAATGAAADVWLMSLPVRYRWVRRPTVSAPFLFKFSVQDFRPTLPGQAGFVQTVSEKKDLRCAIESRTVTDQLLRYQNTQQDTVSQSAKEFFKLFRRNNTPKG